MKIDERIINYEISKNLPNATPGAGESVDEKQPLTGQKVGQEDRLEQDTIVHLSPALKEARMIKEIISSEPDIREDKIADLKERIESGRYQIDHDAVADKLVNHFLDEIS